MRDLNRLVKPKTILIIGGGVCCRSVIDQCQKIGFKGEIWPVHRKKDFAGLSTFNSVDALPGASDAAFVGVNGRATIGVTESLSKRGGGGAVCFASGFHEVEAEDEEGPKLQQRLVEAAAGMPILGTNCYGVINYLNRVALWPDQHG